jgi:hypothetical protein
MDRYAYLVSGTNTNDGRVASRVGRAAHLFDFFEQGARVAAALRYQPSFCGGRAGDVNTCAVYPFCAAHAGMWT